MSENVAARPASKEVKESVSYLDVDHTLISWLTTTDHKRIAILYAISITIFFLIGGLAIGLVRLELMSPRGLLLTDHGYNRLFTLHGIVMEWFFLEPSIPAVFGNFLLPLMIRARDVAFPRLNLLSWYNLYHRGGIGLLRDRRRRRGHGLDILNAVFLLLC